MRLPYNGTWPINQTFNDPCCRASYAQFGLQGHNGIDYGLPSGTAVVAAISGTVMVGNDPGGFGNYVKVTGEYQTIYAHLQKATVLNGQQVQEGQQIGVSDNTGNSSGPHLHFGVKPLNPDNNNGFLGSIDPQPILNKGGSMLANDSTTTLGWVLGMDLPTTDPGYKGFRDYWVGKEEAKMLEWLVNQPRHIDIVTKARNYDKDVAAAGNPTPLKSGTYKVS